ncbi:D-glyceryl-ACP synthase [Rhodovulum adriaticum]|uniref:D-glyceryl-ACP synthase n=2 Tax=Rhodovulum adriaticum TaxID=35804 RepID=A0A4V6NQJ8_RHOAD|nr:D-glyceryl-ACP synthase [Rhodovulum adriaticum]
MADLGTLALLGSANLDILAEALASEAAQWNAALQCRVATYGRAGIDLRDNTSGLCRSLAAGAAAVVFERAEDLLGEAVHRPLRLYDRGQDGIAAAVAPMLDTVRQARARGTGPILVFSLASFSASTLGMVDPAAEQGLAAALKSANAHLREETAGMAGVHWIDTDALIAEVGRQAAAPGMYWHAARAPFSAGFAAALSRRVIAALLFLTGRSTRLLVLDLDNTLWGGVLGEDGMGGLRLGGGYPGGAFREFQSRIKGLADRGIVLAVASKNDTDLALGAMADHPDMLIRPDDLAAHRIGWSEKADGIAAMLEELSLGQAHCMFLDDNPLERAKVRQRLPQCQVPDLPERVEDRIAMLDRHPYLDCLSLTGSDVTRGAQYRARAQLRRAEAAAEDLQAFLRGLDIRITFEPYGPSNRQRIEQLIVKTNQFNATTRRHDAATLAHIAAQGGLILGVGVEDRHTPYEIMGVLILRAARDMGVGLDLSAVSGPADGAWVIDSLMLSCRILGRDVERAMLWQAVQSARGQGAGCLMGQIIPTERNTPVRQIYQGAGFAPLCGAGPGDIWALDLEPGDDRASLLPAHLRVVSARTRPPVAEPPRSPLATVASAPRSPLATTPASPLATSPLSTTAPAPGSAACAAGDPAALNKTLDALFRHKLGLDASTDLSTVTMENTPAWDSLKHVALAMEIEQTMQVRLPMEVLFSIHSYADLRRALADQAGAC